MDYADVQKIAKDTIEYIKGEIHPGISLKEVRRKDDRIYIEKGNNKKLVDVSYFTFEPHISTEGSKYGYKRENIYFFEDGAIREL